MTVHCGGMVPLGTLIRLHVVSNCSQQPFCPDMYTVAACALLNTQWLFLTACSGWFNPSLASHLPLPPPTHPPPIELIHDIGGVQKRLWLLFRQPDALFADYYSGTSCLCACLSIFIQVHCHCVHTVENLGT